MKVKKSETIKNRKAMIRVKEGLSEDIHDFSSLMIGLRKAG